jgi:hypothetical protein
MVFMIFLVSLVSLVLLHQRPPRKATKKTNKTKSMCGTGDRSTWQRAQDGRVRILRPGWPGWQR